uniref:Lipid membrane protein of large eukaryotic DNA virus n=1 Tax=Dikerogammarus haemobaphes virus 1 TaxID=2704946 RepID=A0A6G9HEE6_9VIRU|nr:lipid membrane protein of large eukaryotic DNA virus [Dikerogammarus haemobaphes virus 1]
MGGAQSTTASERIITNTIRDITSISQSCEVTLTGDQLTEISGISGNVVIGDIAFKQKQVINMKCLLTQRNVAKMIDSLRQHITSEVNNESVMSIAANSQASIENKLLNITSAESINNITTTVFNSVVNSQTLTIKDVGGNVIIGNLTMEQQAQTVLNNLLDASDTRSVLKELDSFEESASKNKESTVMGEFLAGVSSIFQSSTMIWVVLIIAALGALFIFLKLKVF